MKNYINRHISQVIERQQKRMSTIIVTGPRRVGKTTMLKETLKSRGVNYISLDNPAIYTSAMETPSRFLQLNKAPIIIDEIQKASKLFEYIKDVVDENEKKGQYYLTGSHNFRLMQGITESLAGRAGVISMLGLSLREINNTNYFEPFMPTDEHFKAIIDKISIPNEAMIKHKVLNDLYTGENDLPRRTYLTDITDIVHRGSFPQLYDILHEKYSGDKRFMYEARTSYSPKEELQDWADFYANYLQTYVEKDVRDITNIQDLSAFIKFIKAVAALSGEQLNYSNLAEICGMDVNTTKRWMSILETSGLVYLLQPYSNNLNNRLIKTPKIYFLDTGLICYLSGWHTPQQLMDGARWGHIFETFVVSEILKSYYNNGIVYAPLYYYRDKERNEIDLIIENGSTLYPVEIKTTSDPNKRMIKSFDLLKSIPNKKIGQGAIICLAKHLMPLTETVLIVPVDMV